MSKHVMNLVSNDPQVVGVLFAYHGIIIVTFKIVEYNKL